MKFLKAADKWNCLHDFFFLPFSIKLFSPECSQCSLHLCELYCDLFPPPQVFCLIYLILLFSLPLLYFHIFIISFSFISIKYLSPGFLYFWLVHLSWWWICLCFRFICIYPVYINSKKTLAEGRRIPTEKVTSTSFLQPFTLNGVKDHQIWSLWTKFS